MLAGQLIRPISELDREARHIKNNEYSSLPRIKTVFNQIQRTADTFYDMKNSVVDYKKELEKTEKIHRAITDTANEAIFMVDDQKEVIRIERLILEVLGYRVTTRLSGKEALETFVASPSTYDMVITDMNMPQMSGETLAGELLVFQPDIPVILLTGYSEGMTRDNARDLGIKDFLMKPVNAV